MEDFEQIKDITLDEARKLLPENIAYITMKDGEVIVINGLDHQKFDKKEKLNTNKNTNNNINNNLHLIKESTEENERNSKLSNNSLNYKYIQRNNNTRYPKFNNNFYVEINAAKRK